MYSKNKHIALGISVIIFGLFLLLSNLRIIYLNSQFFWSAAFIALGIIFINVHQHNKMHRGPLVFGTILIILGLIGLLDSFGSIIDEFPEFLILWFFSAIFVIIYVRNNIKWWSIIPGGLFFILGAMALLDRHSLIEGDLLWVVFFAGFSLIFWFLFLIRDVQNKLHWAKIPAMLLSIFTIFILNMVWSNQFTKLFLPISVILFGIYLLISNMKPKKKNVVDEMQNPQVG